MMTFDIDREVAALGGMTVGQLCDYYAELLGETALSRNKTHLIRRIAWRLQSIMEGDLSERARRRAAELAKEAEVRTNWPRSLPQNPALQAQASVADPRVPRPGTALVQKYKGRQVRVLVLADGFEYDGQRYGSISAVAKAVTGSHCNGFRFFNLENNQ